MRINEKELKDFIKEIISELNLTESDIIAKDKSDWKKMKTEFKKTAKELIKNIEDDKYSDANGDIDKAIKILKSWKKRLSKNLDDSSRI
jgi:predicted house-cleaning noncanonical NTP pyrophosphatase (MazG superfamily)